MISVFLRRSFLCISDMMCWGAAFLCVFWTSHSFSFSGGTLWGFCVLLITICFIQVVSGLIFKIYRNLHVIGSFEDSISVVLLSSFSGLAGFLVYSLVFSHYFYTSPSYFEVFFETVLATFLMLVSRALWRLVRTKRKRFNWMSYREPIFVIGAGDAAYWIINQLVADVHCSYSVVGIIDDSPAKKNFRIRNFKVLGNREALPDLAKNYGVTTVLYCIYNASTEVMESYSDICINSGLKMIVVPNIKELFGSKIELDKIRKLDVQDLLGREPVTVNLEQMSSYITGKRIMVTGAGGSIGSEISRQVHKIGPSELIILDRDENALHSVQLEIYGKALLDTPDMVLCDIRDFEALRRIFVDHKPDVIFHAAALKHLPMIEQYPEEGWKTNTIGTLNLLKIADEFKVQRFVNISTDKAADATSVLGYTKRLAERITSYYSDITGRPFVSVRFGNVLGSRGSVLWTFRHQIDNGKQVTITHPEVERYFMTIREACLLVLQAGAIGRAGEVMVLDMGEPVKIVDVAKKMIALSGKNIEIVFTGMRPGEKLTEVLLGENELGEKPYHPSISHMMVEPLSPDDLINEFARTTKKSEV